MKELEQPGHSFKYIKLSTKKVLNNSSTVQNLINSENTNKKAAKEQGLQLWCRTGVKELEQATVQLNSSAQFAGLNVWHHQVPVKHEGILSPPEARTQKDPQFPSATLAGRDKFRILHCFRSNLTPHSL